MLNKILIISTCFLLFGCGSSRIVTVPDVRTPIVIHPEPPAAAEMREVTWTVLNKERLEEILREGGDELVLFTLTPQGYENLAVNMQEIIRYIREQKEIIIYYRKSFPNTKEDNKKE